MANLILTSENQIQRLNGLLNRVQHLRDLENHLLATRPQPKSWSVLEVLEHLNKAYNLYVGRVNVALEKCPTIHTESKGFQARGWQKFVIESQKPKAGVVKRKMKTLRRFVPQLDLKGLTSETINDIFDNFFELHEHLKESILQSRSKDVTQAKFNSAVGPLVRFYLPEAFEFLIGHMERHMAQIDGVLKQLQTKQEIKS